MPRRSAPRTAGRRLGLVHRRGGNFPHRRLGRAGQDPGGLAGGAERDVLTAAEVRTTGRPSTGGRDLADRRGRGRRRRRAGPGVTGPRWPRARRRRRRARRAGPRRRRGRRSPASHVVEGEAVQRGGGVRAVGRALALEVRHQHQRRRRPAERPGRGRRGPRGRRRAAAGRGVEHPRGVERADQRQVAAGRVGEPGDDAGRVGRGDRRRRRTRRRRCRSRRRRRPVRRPRPSAEAALSPGAGPQRAGRRCACAGGLARAEDPRQHGVVAEGRARAGRGGSRPSTGDQ